MSEFGLSMMNAKHVSKNYSLRDNVNIWARQFAWHPDEELGLTIRWILGHGYRVEMIPVDNFKIIVNDYRWLYPKVDDYIVIFEGLTTAFIDLFTKEEFNRKFISVSEKLGYEGSGPHSDPDFEIEYLNDFKGNSDTVVNPDFGKQKVDGKVEVRL